VVRTSDSPLQACSICSPGTTLVPERCAVRNSKHDGSGEEVYEGGFCTSKCQQIYDEHMSSPVGADECGNIQSHYTHSMRCCIEQSKCHRMLNETQYERLLAAGFKPVNCSGE